ncbi:MAG: hypothetical protein HY744_32670 [Deltaproteobacteria bacterium]|nr:hypothetical protein [Deltaproteobacteria bacterium]
MGQADSRHVHWETRLGEWASSHRRTRNEPGVSETIEKFFERAFVHARHPECSWFGVHTQAASLVVGGIYLAAVNLGKRDFGAWLLVDRQAPKLDHVEYRVVKASRRFDATLRWAHAEDLDQVGLLVESEGTWRSYEAATARIMVCPVAGGRDAVQVRRGKARLVEIADAWQLAGSRSFPDELEHPEAVRTEGARTTVSVDRYERDRRLRKACIRHHGARCGVCGLVLADRYGPLAAGIIQVHHLLPLSEAGAPRQVDPANDLLPVCPNCHTVIHSHQPAYTVKEVRQMILERATDR